MSQSPPQEPPPSPEPFVMTGVAIRPESHHVEKLGPAEHYSMPAPQAEHLRQQERDKATQELKKDMARFGPACSWSWPSSGSRCSCWCATPTMRGRVQRSPPCSDPRSPSSCRRSSPRRSLERHSCNRSFITTRPRLSSC